eukprot:SAG31_NODE_45500_length_258_cov_1.213836_1_plen_25_part_01
MGTAYGLREEYGMVLRKFTERVSIC